MNHNTATIRKLLTAAFNDEDLMALCFDHFREIYHKFGRGLTHSEKVQLLLEYCETNQGLRTPPIMKLLYGGRRSTVGGRIFKGEIYGNCERIRPLDGREVELYGYQQQGPRN